MLCLAGAKRNVRAQRIHQVVKPAFKGRRARDHRELVMVLRGGVEVDGDNQVAVAGHHRDDGQRIKQTAINQHAIALHHRGKQAGDGRRGAHGLVQAAFLKPDFLLMGQVGGDGGIRDAQVFNIDLADNVANLPEDSLATNGPEAKTHVHQAQYIQIIQALNPVAVLVKLAGGINPAHHGAHRTTCNAGNLVTPAFELFNDPDVGIAPRASGAQYQCNTFFHEPVLCKTSAYNAFLCESVTAQSGLAS